MRSKKLSVCLCKLQCLLLILALPPCLGDTSKIFHPGLVLNNLSIPLNSQGTKKTQTITAAKAVVQDPPNLILISDFHASQKELNKNPFLLWANAAVYDIQSCALRASEGFLASYARLNFEGMELRKESGDLVFDAIGHFEIQISELTPFASQLVEKQNHAPSPFHFDTMVSSRWKLPNPMLPLELVQGFAGTLSTFVKCWRWTKEWDLYSSEASKGVMMALISKNGGHVDLDKNAITLAGSSAIISRQAVLISPEGIKLSREGTDDSCVHIMGEGDIQTWVHTPESEGLWIRSSSFDCVSDQKIIQFKGGPLMVGSKGAILAATESWQFVRVFSNGRVALSSGVWATEGNLVGLSK